MMTEKPNALVYKLAEACRSLQKQPKLTASHICWLHVQAASATSDLDLYVCSRVPLAPEDYALYCTIGSLDNIVSACL